MKNAKKPIILHGYCNLQKKSGNIDHGQYLLDIYKDINERFCKKCGAPLKLKKGIYGDFYGCINYPKCNYTEKC